MLCRAGRTQPKHAQAADTPFAIIEGGASRAHAREDWQGLDSTLTELRIVDAKEQVAAIERQRRRRQWAAGIAIAVIIAAWAAYSLGGAWRLFGVAP